MRRLFVLSVVVVLLMLSGCGGGGSTATGEIQGSVLSVAKLSGPVLESDMYAIDEKLLDTVGMNGVVGKGYIFVMRGDFNDWDCNGTWDKLQPSDIIAVDADGVLRIYGNELLSQARSHSTTAMRDGKVCLIAYDSAGNIVAQTRTGLKLCDLLRALLPDARVNVVGEGISVNTDESGNFKILGVPSGLQVLEISHDNCLSSKVMVNVLTNSQTTVGPIELEYIQPAEN